MSTSPSATTPAAPNTAPRSSPCCSSCSVTVTVTVTVIGSWSWSLPVALPVSTTRTCSPAAVAATAPRQRPARAASSTSSVTEEGKALTPSSVTGWRPTANTSVPPTSWVCPKPMTRSRARSRTPHEAGAVSNSSAPSRALTTAADPVPATATPALRPRPHRASGCGPPHCPAGHAWTTPRAPNPAPGDVHPANPHTTSPTSPPPRVSPATPRVPPAGITSPTPRRGPPPGRRAKGFRWRRHTTTHRRRGTWPDPAPRQPGWPVTAHHHPQRGFADPFQLQIQQPLTGLQVELGSFGDAFGISHHRRPLPHRSVVNDQKPPRLRVPHRRCRMRSPHHPLPLLPLPGERQVPSSSAVGRRSR